MNKESFVDKKVDTGGMVGMPFLHIGLARKMVNGLSEVAAAQERGIKGVEVEKMIIETGGKIGDFIDGEIKVLGESLTRNLMGVTVKSSDYLTKEERVFAGMIFLKRVLGYDDKSEVGIWIKNTKQLFLQQA